MSMIRGAQHGVWHCNRSGGCSFWSGYSTLPPQCKGGSSNVTGKDAPTWPQQIQRIQPPCNPQYGACWGKDILGVVDDIYHGQYQLAPSTISHQHLDLLMQELHDDLDHRLVRDSLHSTTSSGRSQSRGRAHSYAPQWAHSFVTGSVAIIRDHSPTAAWMEHYVSKLSPVLRPCAGPGVPLCFPKRQRASTHLLTIKNSAGPWGSWTTPAFKSAHWGSSLWSH